MRACAKKSSIHNSTSYSRLSSTLTGRCFECCKAYREGNCRLSVEAACDCRIIETKQCAIPCEQGEKIILFLHKHVSTI